MAHNELYNAANDRAQVDKNAFKVFKASLEPLNADPDTLEDGDLWYRGDLDELRVRLTGVTEVVQFA